MFAVMSREFESLDRQLMVEIIRRRQLPHNKISHEAHFEKSNDAGTTLEQDMAMFLKNVGQEFCDITLLLDGVSIPAHKTVLAARCGYFEAMFRLVFIYDVYII